MRGNSAVYYDRETMLKVENVSKIYRLGEIGGTTLKDELQRLHAKIHKKEDPTKKVGAKNYKKGEKFKALNRISFEVKKGERIGIIGHNGAGKSTLLKLISRVTGPTEGNIYLNGRVASMLEVGTGFHPELTGRENIYMNGAILGMTKKEIDSKMNKIIEFSEVNEFIDTPVKRYSSGMYVKLAFSVAAHLDSEIVIMDEVLAVGDMAFQNKCLNKMKEISEQDSRTILYVSHNMGTIKKLCNRVIVLEQGSIKYDGDVETGILLYLVGEKGDKKSRIDNRHFPYKKDYFSIEEVYLLGDRDVLCAGDLVEAKIGFSSAIDIANVRIRFEISTTETGTIGTAFSKSFFVKKGLNERNMQFSTKLFVPGEYIFNIIIFESDESGNEVVLDGIYPAFLISITNEKNEYLDINWLSEYWGQIHLNSILIK